MSSNSRFMNIIFQTNQGKIYNLVFSYGETINQVLIEFLKKIGRTDLIGNSNKISFLFNTNQIDFSEQRTVKQFFNKMQTAKIFVNFKDQLNNDMNINYKKSLSHNYINNFNNNCQQENEIIELKRQLNDERDKNKKLIQQNLKLTENIEGLNIEIAKLRSLLEVKEKEKEKKYKIGDSIQNEYLTLEPNEKILAVNFVSMGLNDIGHYNLICKNTDLFVKLEEKLYKDFPQFKEYETFFEVKGKRIRRFKTMDGNSIRNNDVISIFVNEE